MMPMSTSIANGYRLADGTDPFLFAARLRKVMDPARDAADAALLAGLYVRAIDAPWFRGEAVKEGAGVEAWRAWKKEQNGMGSMQRDHDPNEFGVQIGLDPVTGRHLLLLISYNDILTEEFRTLDEVEPYGYWTAEEPPEGVTEEEWAERRASWARVIPRPGYTNMLSFNLRPVWDGGVRRLLGLDKEDTSQVFSALPSEAVRARNAGGDAYASFLVRDKGVDILDAVRFVGFGRSAQLNLVTDIAAAYLPVIDQGLVTEGSRGAVIEPGYAPAMQAACEALYELDKERLAR